MKIVNLQVREVSVPRAYETYCADPDGLQSDTDHTRSRYQIIEIFHSHSGTLQESSGGLGCVYFQMGGSLWGSQELTSG